MSDKLSSNHDRRNVSLGELRAAVRSLGVPEPQRPVAFAIVDERGRVEDGRICRHYDKAEERRAAMPNPERYRVVALVFAEGAVSVRRG